MRLLLLLLTLVLTGCGGEEDLPPPVRATVAVDDASVVIDGLAEPLLVDVARTPEELSRGLMGVEELAPGTGMLFEFGDTAERSFWMANTLIPLDIAWIEGGRVTGVTSMVPCTAADTADCPRYPSPGEADSALEAPPGTFAPVEPGAAVRVTER